MSGFFNSWWVGLAPGAQVCVAVLVALTVALIRAANNPTMFALMSLPGTMAHEASHAAAGVLLNAKPVSFSIWPRKMPDGSWQLGAVGFANITWWNGPPVALAPMLLAPLSVYMTTEWAYPAWVAGDALGGALRLGLCALFLHASWPSTADLRIALPGLLILSAVIAILW